MMCRCQYVMDAGTPIGTLNSMNGRLLTLAKEKGIPVYQGWQALRDGMDCQKKATA